MAPRWYTARFGISAATAANTSGLPFLLDALFVGDSLLLQMYDAAKCFLREFAPSMDPHRPWPAVLQVQNLLHEQEKKAKDHVRLQIRWAEPGRHFGR